MAYVYINGNKYDIPEVDFDAICELEEMGVELLALNRNSPKLATMVRGLTAWIMGVDTRTASQEIEQHIQNGGNIVDIISRVSDAVKKSGFFAQNRPKPQDHQSKGGKVQQYPQNQGQRRKSKKNGNRSRK